jgi:hypothetical protein
MDCEDKYDPASFVAFCEMALFAPARRDFLLRNTRLPDGSPAVKEDIERYILGHAGKRAHAGYGEQWFETLKAAIEFIPNPLAGSTSEEPIPQ